MIKLSFFNDGEDQVMELPVGEYTIGSDESCMLQVNSPSLSGVHCQLSITDDSVIIARIDLDGYLALNEIEIEEEILSPGDTFTAGQLDFMYLERIQPATSEGRVRIDLNSGSAVPSETLETPASSELSLAENNVLCTVCGGTFALDQCNSRLIGGETKVFCPECGGQCTTSTDVKKAQIKKEKEESERPESFKKWLMKSLSYPFHAEGIVVIVTGVLFFAVIQFCLWVVQWAGLLGLAATIILSILGGGYYLEFLKGIILHSAKGEDRLEWPSMDDFGELATTLILTLILGFLCFLPTLLWAIFAPQDLGTLKMIVTFIFVFVGMFVFPMGFLGYTLYDSFSILSPDFLFPSIMRVKGDYLMIWLIFGLGLFIQFAFEWVLDLFMFTTFARFFGMFVGAYFYVVVMRALGYLYFYNKRKLGWDV